MSSGKSDGNQGSQKTGGISSRSVGTPSGRVSRSGEISISPKNIATGVAEVATGVLIATGGIIGAASVAPETMGASAMVAMQGLQWEAQWLPMGLEL